MCLKSIRCLESDSLLETDTFEVGGFMWKLLLLRIFPLQCPPESLQIHLYSCNEYWVGAHATFGFLNQHAEDNITKETVFNAAPFGYGDWHGIDYSVVNDQEEGFLFQDRVLVEVDLKDIKIMPFVEKRTLGNDMRAVSVELIDQNSIAEWLERHSFGIASVTMERHGLVMANTLIRPMVDLVSIELFPEYRLWLCKWDTDGNLSVVWCLNESGPVDCVKCTCDEGNWNDAWITLFKETKIADKDLLPITDESAIIFCKLYDPEQKRMRYLGHILTEKTSLLLILLVEIRNMAGIAEDTESKMYAEDNGVQLKEVTDLQASLAENGLHSGSVLIVRPGKKNENLSARAFCQYLYSLEESGPAIGPAETEEDIPAMEVPTHDIVDLITGPPEFMSREEEKEKRTHFMLTKSCFPSPKSPQRVPRVIEDGLVSKVQPRKPENLVLWMEDAIDASTTLREAWSSTSFLVVDFEELISSQDMEHDLQDRLSRPALMMADAFVKDNPIFLLNIGCCYRLRLGLVHATQMQAKNETIRGVFLQPSNGKGIQPSIYETRATSEGHEVVALFNPKNYKTPSLLKKSDWSRSPTEKYVRLTITVVVEVMAEKKRRQRSDGLMVTDNLFCCMVDGGLPASVQRFERFANEQWQRCPRWIQDGARGFVLCPEVLLKATSKLSSAVRVPIVPRWLRRLLKPCFPSLSTDLRNRTDTFVFFS